MSTITETRDVVGVSARRPDGIPKVKGAFAYSSDAWADRMLWGSTLRSPHPRARIRGIEIGAALRVPGVHAVLTHEDVPGRKTYGLEIQDQPVLAWEDVRYQGEPIALVAADHPETARAAARKIEVDYEVLEPLTDPEKALDPDTPPLHPRGNLLRHVPIRHGDPDATGDVVITGEYTVGMQDQAFLGPESGLAVPAEDGGVDLFIATQWLHVDQDQLAASLDLPPEKVRLVLGGVGGAFGGREDLSMQVHACMLALHTDRPVKMMYGREESFFGHIHRHPARMRYEHHATRDGRQHLVVDDDPLGRPASGLGMVGGDQRHRLALVADELRRQHRLVGVLEAEGVLPGDVVGRQNRPHPRHAERLGDVDAPDPRVRMRAAQGDAPDHLVVPQVAGVGELAGDLQRAVGPQRAVADAPLGRGRRGRRGRRRPGAHRAVCRSAASRTASRIFS